MLGFNFNVSDHESCRLKDLESIRLEDHNVRPSPVGLGKQTKYNVIL